MSFNKSELMGEFSSKSYLEKIVKIVTSFKTGKITGDEADAFALHLNIDPKDLTSIFEYGYSRSKKLFTQPKITLAQITSDKATHLEKIVLLALELKRNNISPIEMRDYANMSNIDPRDVQNIYTKIEKEVEKLKKVKLEASKINKGIDEKEIQYTYSTLHRHILQLFLYASPAYAFALLYKNANIKFDENENFLLFMNKVSDGGAIEKGVSDAENGFLNLFLSTISTTRDELSTIVQTELGQAFSCTKETAEGITNTLKSFRQVADNEARDFISVSNQLRPLLEDAESDLGGMGLDFLKGAGIGHMAAVALGPAGVALAMASLYLKGQNDTDKIQEGYDKLSTHWDKCFESLYTEKLPIYYKKCYDFSHNIADQYIANFKEVEVLARQNDKLTAYNEYLQNQLRFFVNDERQQQMREDIQTIENIIK